MSYYMLKQDMRIPDQPTVTGCPEGFNIEDWIDGKTMPDPGSLRFKLSPKSGEFRGAIIGGLVTLAHRFLVGEMEKLGIENVQTFPVEIETPAGAIQKAYSLMNVVGLLEAVDKDASVIKPTATGVRGQLYSFTIDPEKAKGHRIFRIAEAPTLIIIDQTVRNALTDLQAPGIIMLETERYDGWG